MARELYDESIDKHTDWGGDESTDGKPVSGARVQEFLKNQLEMKAGCFYYDSSNQRYLVFADEENRDLYLEDPQEHASLLIATFDAPSEYEASITMISSSSVAILSGTKGQRLKYSFDIVNRNGSSVGDDVNVTYTFKRGSRVQKMNARYAYGSTVDVNIDDYLLDGTNSITIAVSGVNTLAATTYAVTYKVINLALTDSFDISKMYGSSGTLAIPFSVSGTGTKTLEWYIDGTKKAKVTSEDEIVTVDYSGVKYISFSGLSRGIHHLQFRCMVMEGEEPFYSQWLYREFIVHTGSSTSPLVAIAGTVADGSSDPVASGHRLTLTGLTQYVPYELTFAVYNPASGQSTTAVDIQLDGVSQATVTATNEDVMTYTLTPMTDGEHTIRLHAGSVNSDIDIEVDETSMDIHEITGNLIVAFNASGRSNSSSSRNQWSYTGSDGQTYTGTFSGFEWNDLSGWSNNRLIISAGAYFSINVKPFSWNVKESGLTIEMEYATSNVSDDDAVICNMLASQIGLKLTASEASLTNSIWINSLDNEKKALKTRFKSGELNRITFVINPYQNVSNAGLVFIYINGRLSGAKAYTSEASFESNANFRFQGSSSAVVELKQLLIYKTALSAEDVYNNYVLYRNTLDEMMSVYDKNDIYLPGTTTLDPDKLANAMPVMLFTGDIPALENEYSDKKKQIVVDVIYNNMQDPSKSFTLTNATLTPQGTSSMAYPKKNFRLYTRKYTQAVLKDADGHVVADGLYAFKDGAQRVACWCLKADYAESSSSHNTGVARLWNKLLYDAKVTYDASETSSAANSVSNAYALRTEAQKAALENDYGYDVRTCVDGFPIMCFYRPNADSDYIFIGKYNFNNDKSTESVFGFCDIPGFDDTDMQCWECLDNSNPISLFTDLTNFDSSWDEAFESRYPDTSNPPGLSQLKTFALWVNGSTVGSTTFSTQKWSHLDVYKMAAYYLYLMVFGAVDQTTKNSMLTSEDGAHYYYTNYDNDTILGVRNDGILAFPPTIDRQSIDDSYQGITAYAYAGHDNKLWNLLEGDTEFMAIVRAVYDALYGAGMNYATLIDMFDTKQSLLWCERVANLDADYKYLSPYRSEAHTDHLEMLQGARSAHRRWWLSKRLALYDAKYVGGEYRSNIFQFKVATGTPANISMSIKAGTDLYYGYGINSVVYDSGVHLTAGQSKTWTIARELAIGDPVSIYAGIYLQEVNISNYFAYLTNVEMSTVYSAATDTTMLKKVLLGSGYGTNTSLTAISGLASAKKLEYLDVRGFAGLTSLDLTANPYLTTLLAQRTGCGQIDLVDGSVITTLGLPSALSVLRLVNCPNITPSGISFEDSYGKNIKTIDVRGCTKSAMKQAWSLWWDWYQNKNATNSQCSVYIDNIEWSGVSASNLLTFGQGLSQGSLTLKGKITLSDTDLTSQQISSLRATFGEHCFDDGNDLVIQTLQDIVVLEGPTELVEGTSAQYHLTVISTKTGTIEYVLSNPSQREGVALSDSGELTVAETGAADSTVVVFGRFRPTVGDMVQRTINVTILKCLYPPISSVTLGGPNVLTSLNSTLTATFANPEDYSGYTKCEGVWTLTGDMASHFSITSQNKTSCNIRRNDTNFVYIQGTITYTLQYLRGNETIVIGSKTYSIQAYDNTQIAVLDAINHPLMSKMWELYGTNGTKVAGKLSNENYITRTEAHSFVDSDLVVGTSTSNGMFYSVRTTLTSLDELQYFDQITTLPAYFAYGCTKLVDITFPPRLTTINTYALASANGSAASDTMFLDMDIILPDTLTTIGSGAFRGCAMRKFVANGLLSIPDALFGHVTHLKEVICENVTSVNGSVFSWSANRPSTGLIPLERFYVPKVISWSSFSFNNAWFTGPLELTVGSLSPTSTYWNDKIPSGSTLTLSKYCTSLGANIIAPDSTRNFNFSHFQVDEENTTYFTNGDVIIDMALNKVVMSANTPNPILPTGVTSIGDKAFAQRKAIETLTIPSSISSIGDSVCQSCTALKNITIDCGVAIPTNAFLGCTAVESIHIGEHYTTGMTNLAQSFSRSVRGSITSLTVDAINSVYKSENNTIFSKDGTTLYMGISGATIPSSVTTIGSYALAYCNLSTWNSLPNTITKLSNNCFFNSTLATTFTLHDGLTLSTNMFSYANIEKLIILCTSIPSNAFTHMESLKTIDIRNATSILSRAFSSCSVVDSIYLRMSSLPSMATTWDDTPFGVGSTTAGYSQRNLGTNVLYVPSSLGDAYAASNAIKNGLLSASGGFTISATL